VAFKDRSGPVLEEDYQFELHAEHKQIELSCDSGISHELDQPGRILELEC
jgi:hypothetical protein